ncbi:DNA adenine methylase [Novosphingobium sp. CF614]|uniref:DNA adenine methylase n=1 Tax=Novosphingobium sp. CF614 TaxID=1884364 RepID=UPI0008EE240F|nr:DNA adenine methylase [Novosphingobium sp. CF614]SFG09332.1 DNA adenine methylase [Novosphingobium sp. CF614]
MTKPRPILRWHGGKWLLAPWIISHFPPHRVYIEPYGGAWSVGFRKPRASAEVWNDLDGELVNLFRVLRDPVHAGNLVAALRLTPFAREEFIAAYEPSTCAIERARRLIVRSFMGHGSDGASGQYRTGFRANSNRAGSTPAVDWTNLPDSLHLAVSRLRGVIIESRPALQVMTSHDGPETLHYVDPPYLHETRARTHRRADNGGVYRHELTDDEHLDLLAFLNGLKGMVVLSGYPSRIYDNALPGWTRIDISARADGALPRTESIWLNPACADRRPSPDLLELA